MHFSSGQESIGRSHRLLWMFGREGKAWLLCCRMNSLPGNLCINFGCLRSKCRVYRGICHSHMWSYKSVLVGIQCIELSLIWQKCLLDKLICLLDSLGRSSQLDIPCKKLDSIDLSSNLRMMRN